MIYDFRLGSIMNIKKHFSVGSKKQIWRIIIDENERLILETRDVASKEVFFQCYNLPDGKKIFTDFQFEEKSWIGIEAVYNNIIFLHKYEKPDMPVHRGVIAFDIPTKKILWENQSLAFLFTLDGKIYCFSQGFEGRTFYALDAVSGEIIENLGENYLLANELRAKSEYEKDWNNYSYPEKLTNAETGIQNTVSKILSGKKIIEDAEFLVAGDLCMINFHTSPGGNLYDNNFMAFQIETGKIIHSELLNSKSTSFYTDSFFIYKNFLFLLKEKNEVKIFKLE